MAADDVERVHELFEQRHRGLFSSRLFDPEVVYTQNGSDVPDFAGEWIGIDGIRAATRAWLDTWEGVRYACEEVVSVDDRIIVHESMTARGVRGRVQTTHVIAHVLLLHNGRISRWDAYWNPAEAPVRPSAQ